MGGQRLSSNPLEMSSLVGIDQRFVQRELEMIQSLASGTALEHHLEPSYFAALEIAAAMSLARDSDKASILADVKAAEAAAREAGGVAEGNKAVTSEAVTSEAVTSDGVEEVLVSLADVVGAVERWRARQE